MTDWRAWLERPLSRQHYAVAGLLLAAVKHNLDRLMASFVFGRQWGVFNYVVPPDEIHATEASVAPFYLTLGLLAVPFVAVGTALTVRRLRDAGWPPVLVLLFFVPVVNLAFFLILCIVPPHAGRDARERPFLDRVMPHGAAGSAAAAMGLVVPFGLLGALLAVTGLKSYGWGLFVGLPFAIGLLAAMVYGYRAQRTLAGCIGVAMLALLLLAVALLALAFEGVICLVMATPLLVALALLGATVGWAIQRHGRPPRQVPAVAGALVLFLPSMILGEKAAALPPPAYAVTTTVEVDAPPAVVWQHVVSFSTLPRPTELIFRTGIAYPVRAVIDGRGPGAIRRCEFSTGAFVEPITVWDEPRRLAFDVASQPAPMQEWTPWSDVQPPHLTGYLQSLRGEFLLEPLPGGRTRLSGTTWYRHNLWPAPYWRLWSDAILHTIHRRVLRHVASLSERAPAGDVLD